MRDRFREIREEAQRGFTQAWRYTTGADIPTTEQRRRMVEANIEPVSAIYPGEIVIEEGAFISRRPTRNIPEDRVRFSDIRSVYGHDIQGRDRFFIQRAVIGSAANPENPQVKTQWIVLRVALKDPHLDPNQVRRPTQPTPGNTGLTPYNPGIGGVQQGETCLFVPMPTIGNEEEHIRFATPGVKLIPARAINGDIYRTTNPDKPVKENPKKLCRVVEH